jgi:predicted dehydrogenase
MPTSKLSPTLRWGVIATGQISSWFVRDLALSRHDAKANHIISAIGSSSKSKGERFIKKYISELEPRPKVYGSYAEVYVDSQVDIIYIGTPHACHKQNCLDAINAGKHVLCEKAFTINAREAEEVFTAAKAKGVFVMEAMWTRFFPLVQDLQNLVHEEKIIGDVRRVFCDLGLDMDFTSLGAESRLKNLTLGAGTLLDIGIYSLTWGLLTLEYGHRQEEPPSVVAVQSISDGGVDVATSVLMLYPSTGKQGILTSTALGKTPDVFCRIEGSKGYITVEGISASAPSAFTVHQKDGEYKTGKKYAVNHSGFGLFWEADAVALDIAAGRSESTVMPWAETLRVLELMDEIRRQGGARFPQDKE